MYGQVLKARQARGRGLVPASTWYQLPGTHVYEGRQLHCDPTGRRIPGTYTYGTTYQGILFEAIHKPVHTTGGKFNAYKQ